MPFPTRKRLTQPPMPRKIFMDYSNLENTTLYHSFFAPLTTIYLQSQKQYSCNTISDIDFAKLGCLRCLSSALTGNEFIQNHALETSEFYQISHFFKALKSKRRLANLMSLNGLLEKYSRPLLPDAFAISPELDNFDIYAGDGHYQKAASFDQKIIGKKRATGHFFRLNLRNHHLDYISLEKRDLGMKKKHDARIIKEADPEELRNHAPKGRQVIYCWDKACIDYHQWAKLNTTTESISSLRKKLTVPLNVEAMISMIKQIHVTKASPQTALSGLVDKQCDASSIQILVTGRLTLISPMNSPFQPLLSCSFINNLGIKKKYFTS